MNSDNDREREHDHGVRWSVFGAHGGQVGPVMVSTDSAVLRATGTVLGAIGVYGFAIWLTLSTGALTGIAQWVAIGLFGVGGLLTIHTALVELYSAGIKTAIEHQPLGEVEVDER